MGTPAENVTKLKDAYRQWHETKGGSVKVWLDMMVDDVKVRSLAAGAPRGPIHCRDKFQGTIQAVLRRLARRLADD
jgi:hypothetical protein